MQWLWSNLNPNSNILKITISLEVAVDNKFDGGIETCTGVVAEAIAPLKVIKFEKDVLQPNLQSKLSF